MKEIQIDVNSNHGNTRQEDENLSAEQLDIELQDDFNYEDESVPDPNIMPLRTEDSATEYSIESMLDHQNMHKRRVKSHMFDTVVNRRPNIAKPKADSKARSISLAHL